MNAETKRHIDAARQVLVGVVPNPTSQIDQITNALIYKFMDDMDHAAIKQGDQPTFFVGDLEKYAWSRLMDARLGNQEKMNLYGEALAKFSVSEQLPLLFRDIFRSAFLPYRSPEVLGLFLKEINFFDYSHPEELGNGYEYLLSVMSSQGDAGQFRTPRHIIDFIVEVVNPTVEDKVLDPACGTAGFLISAYKHILKQHDRKDDPEKKEKQLTPDQRRNLFNNFEGYDIDPGMVRIAQVNMYLHQFKNPKIFQYDSLSNEERWNDKFDVILANPPFMSPKGGSTPHKKFTIPSNRSEVLFVDYIMHALKPKGRAGVIVPEGIIFQSGNAYKQLRKNMVDGGLYGVVSLPSGVFNPYAGVKTSILLFNNDLAKGKDEIVFIKVENDGFSLGANKRRIDKDDLPEALEVLNKWSSGEKVESKKVVYVEKKKIEESGDYNLSGDRYRLSTEYSNLKWPMMELKEICETQNGLWTGKKPPFVRAKVIRNTNFMKKTGLLSFDNIAVLDVEEKQFEKRRLSKGDIILENSGGSPAQPVGRVAYFDSEDVEYSYSNFTSRIRVTNKDTSSKYLWYILTEVYRQGRTENMQSHTSGIKNLDKKLYLSNKVPLPPLEVQEQIVCELDGYQNIINGAKQIVQNWKPKIDIDPEWEKVNLDEVLDRVSEQVNPKDRAGEIFYIGLENIESGSGIMTQNSLSKYEEIRSSKNVFKKGDLLYGKLRPNLNKVWLANRNGICSTDIIVFRGKDISNTNFYWYLLLSQDFVDGVMVGIKGSQLPRVGFEYLRSLKIPCPPLEIQKQIVNKIEKERELVESAKKLTEIYEQKSKETIAKLWNE
jgi:type I restriction enzyme M protein